jgi:hypothetical protein
VKAAVSQLDPGKVPADLRDLLPLAQRWGIGDDVDRAWLDTFKPGTMTDEAAAFMYAQLAIEDMP